MALTSVAIRPLAVPDRRVVLELARSLGEWFNAAGLALLERDLQSHGGFVAVDRGRVIGFVTWNRFDDGTANLSWIGIAKSFHRMGIGRALVRILATGLRAEGDSFLDVSTVADSVDYEPYANTRRFYRGIGFRDLRVDPLFYGEGEDRYDRLVLRLRLDEPEGALG